MPHEDTGKTGRKIGKLDGQAVGKVDRRRFLRGAAGTVGAGLIAGCTGITGGGGSGNDTEAVFTTPWKKEPSWGHAHVAEGRGYWEDAGVPNIDATRGNGSDTESANIGTGNKPMGVTSLTTAISVYPETQDREALDMSIVGLARGRPLLSLIWRKDKMSDRTDLSGKTILAASGFAAATIEVYPALVGVSLEEVTIQESSEESAPAKLASGEVDAVWGSIDLLPAYEEEVDAELGATPLTAFGGFPGYPIWVNNEWYEGLDDGPEFVSRVMTGYFKALKWGVLNQAEYLDYLKNEVNENLQTWTEEELTGQHSVNAAQAVTLEMEDEGLGYFTEDGVQNALDAAGQVLVDDPSALPSASELIIEEPWENTERVTFTDDEWNQLAETAGRVWTLFEEAEAGN